MADFTTVTETPDIRISREALAMVYARYAFAASFCRDRHVLEVACGVGQGLGYLARGAAQVVGGDLSAGLIRQAHAHYKDRIPLVQFDAQALPFRDQSFDVVILHEAIYYLSSPERFIAESRRILRSAGGVLVIGTVNPQWQDFNPSPMSTQYLDAQQLSALLSSQGLRTQVYGAFPVERCSWRARGVSWLKRAAVTLRLVPRTMKGKQLLKRIFLGPLVPSPNEVVDGMASYSEPVEIQAGDDGCCFKVLFAVGYRL